MTEAAHLHRDLLPGLGIGPQDPGALGGGLEQLVGLLHRQLVRGDVLGDRAGDAVVLDEGPVAPDPGHDGHVLKAADLDGADLPGIRLLLGLVDEGQQAGGSLARLLAPGALVEGAHVGDGIEITLGDGVQAALELGGELVVHQVIEVLLKQVGHREGGPRGDQGGAPLEHIAPALDGLDDGGVGARPADAPGLQLADDGGVGEAGGRLGAVALGLGALDGGLVPLGEIGEQALAGAALAVVASAVAVLGVLALDVGPAEALEGVGLARGPEPGGAVALRGDLGVQGHAHAGGVGHLAGEGAAHDQGVEPGLVIAELRPAGVGVFDHVAGGPDGLVGLLGPLR